MLKRSQLTSDKFEIYFQNWKSLSIAIANSGGVPQHVLDNVEDFLVTLATNGILIDAEYQDPTVKN